MNRFTLLSPDIYSPLKYNTIEEINITKLKNIKDIQSKIKVITTELEFKLNNSHSINQACPLSKHIKESTKQTEQPLKRNNILDKYKETIHTTI